LLEEKKILKAYQQPWGLHPV